ncbi:MAG: RloB family protein, partial [Sumerlaeia bacterium]
KPVKFSDSKRKWFNQALPKRKYVIYPELKRFLIVCEGTKTEPNYFKSIGKTLSKNTVKITMEGAGQNTLSLLKHAFELFSKSQKSNDPFDEVWIVFDRDSFPPDDFDNAIKYARKHKMRTAWSNEAFEFWYLLHFEYRNTHMSRQEYSEELSKYLDQSYKKICKTCTLY